MAEESPTSPTGSAGLEKGRSRRKRQVSLAEYRERKWGLDAQWKQMQKSAPSFSMRPKTTFGTMLSLKAQSSGYKGDLGREFAFTKKKQPSFSMGAKPMGHCFETKSPGPAEYQVPFTTLDPQSPHPNFPAIKGGRFGSSPAAGSLTTLVEKCPGPGDYESKFYVSTLDGKKPPSWTIRSQLAGSIVAAGGSGLGPGVYDISKTLKDGKITSPTWTLLGRESLYNPKGYTPGAGTYTPAFENNSPIGRRPAYTFGFTERFGFSDEKQSKNSQQVAMRQTH